MEKISAQKPREHYQKRYDRYGKLAKKLARNADRISNLRLFVFIGGCGLGIVLHRTLFLSLGALLLAALSFVYLVIRHNRVLGTKGYVLALFSINENSLKRLEGKWTSFPDAGEDNKDDNHAYATDLDIFGRGSLFQWLNSTQTIFGRKRLKEVLTQQSDYPEGIRQRQDAILELSGKCTWRQRFIAEGMISTNKLTDAEPLLNWSAEIHEFYCKPTAKVVFRIMPLVTTLLIIFYYTTSLVHFYWPLLALLVQALILFSFSKERSRALNAVFKYEGSIKVYYRMLCLLEKKRFSTDLLRKLQSQLRCKDNIPAYVQVEKLAKIADFIASRGNAIFLIINIITLWDFQCMIALEGWKKRSGQLLPKWLHTIGEMEALISLAVIAHDHPKWVIPKIVQGPPSLMAEALGHPLLSTERVTNDLNLQSSSGILLITGSNMSGKSTLLRTAGLNLVLAYAGAPVCAEQFSCSLLRIYTCMRVSDNLEKSISSFYAELLRIKMIVEASKDTRPLLFLLDEIFKGTNSQDRHTGAKILIKQLSQKGAVGLVSTHDLELGELEKESGGKVKNFHFREYYQNDQIYFDYKLRSGIATTQNALYLIKLVGIEDDGEETSW